MRKWIGGILLLWMLTLLYGCGSASVRQGAEIQETLDAPAENSVSGNRMADSLDRAIIQNVDVENQKITFYNLKLGKSYILSYDSATGIKDRHDEELVAPQLQVGDVAFVTFLKETRQAKSIRLDQSVSRTDVVRQFEINRTAYWMNIGDVRYAIAENAAVLTSEKLLSLMDINEADTIAVYADDAHTIYSIVITNEHGYVRLSGEDAFIGGFVEFGQSVIRQVSQDMLVVLPSGTYDMFISYQNNAGNKQVEVLPGQETVVDVSDLVKEEEKREGGIIFTITPTGAILKIDGEETDYSSVVTLSYGIHQIIAVCDGYKTITQYIKVGQEMANINIEMEKSNAENDSSAGESSVSGNTAVTQASDGFRVYIDAPTGAELYVEGKYIGIIPTSFDKKAGNYVISVRKSGYTTRSYSLEIDDSNKDVHYSFSELVLSQ